MKQLNVTKQRGAVLAFSLVMLLLLTLVGVSMIQQNKQELSMAGNARQQTQALATAEAEMSRAELAIDGIRFDDEVAKNARRCNATQLDEGDVIADVTTAVATINAVYCLTAPLRDSVSGIIVSGGTEQRCEYDNGQRGENNACERLSHPATILGCPIELYTIHTTFTGSKGAQRTVESKYAVDCTGNTG